jgi:hypothetical protein
LARIDGFRTLSAVTKDTNEPALTSQVVSLHRVYLEYIQNARSLHPLQDSGSVGPWGPASSAAAPYHQTSHHISTRNDRAYSTSSTGSVGYSGGGASSYGFSSSYNTGGPGTIRSSSNNSSRNFLNTQHLQQQQQHQSATYGHSAPYAPALSMANLLSGSHSAMHNGHSASNQNHDLDSQVEDGSIAAMGFNIAFNLVNELLK